MDKQKQSILIVDDEEVILFAFKDVLSEPWLAVDTAQSLEEAHAYLDNKNVYNGAIIDLRLGGSNGFEGFEVIHMVRQYNPQCKILMMTAYAKPGTKERAFAEGADFFMEKPVSPEEVVTMFRSHGVLIHAPN